MRAGADGCELAFHAAATLGDWGRATSSSAATSIGTETCSRRCADAGVRRFVHVGTEAALMAGRPLVNVDETAPLRPDSPALYSATKARAEQARARRQPRRLRDGRRPPPLRLGPRRHDAAAHDGRDGAQRALRVDRRWTPPHLDHARRQRRRGPDLEARHAGVRQRLLRHRRRARRVPRVRHRAARDPGCGGPHPHAPAAGGGGRDAGRGRLAPRCRSPASRRSPASPTGSPPRSARSGSTRPASSSATRR